MATARVNDGRRGGVTEAERRKRVKGAITEMSEEFNPSSRAQAPSSLPQQRSPRSSSRKPSGRDPTTPVEPR